MSAVLDLTNRLIAVPSTTDNPQALNQVLKVAGQELSDFSKKDFIQNGIPSVLYSNQPDATNFKVILNAHLDVVPGKPEQYTSTVKDGKLWGRGACDMKSGAAAEILAFKDVAKKINYPLGLQLVTDEEIGGFSGTKYQLDQGIRPEFVIAGESTNLQLNNLAKGIFLVKITAHGSPAHAAYLWNGKNAIWLMQEFLSQLHQAFPIPEQEAWVTTANLAIIETSNITFNKVPDECSVNVDIRYIPEEASGIESKIRSLLPPGFTLEIKEKEPSQKTDQANPYLQKLDNSLKSVLGKSPGFIAKHGASDIRHYDRINIPGVCFGPIGDGLHSNEEWGDIASFDQYYRVLTEFLLSL